MLRNLSGFILMVLVFAGGLQTLQAQKIKVVRDVESANILTVAVASNLPDGELADKIEKDGRGRSTFTENSDKVRQAFVFCVPSGSKEVPSCVQRVFVTDLGLDETYEVKGEELFIEANRPINNLKWINDFTISYERWAGPHFGRRYVVDIKKRKQTAAFILSDQ